MHNSSSPTEAAAGVAFYSLRSPLSGSGYTATRSASLRSLSSDRAGYPVENAPSQQPHLDYQKCAFSSPLGIG